MPIDLVSASAIWGLFSLSRVNDTQAGLASLPETLALQNM